MLNYGFFNCRNLHTFSIRYKSVKKFYVLHPLKIKRTITEIFNKMTSKFSNLDSPFSIPELLPC